ncbi:hypothetical protein O3S68_22035 [Kosakonia sp. SOY2]|uniref:hypothetical protein n=1 Tax=Kosakonia sp. SOY2 TaxID=3014557 RepID=UPI0022ABCA32|nr:hypothetical protein [Kosakonia sp. SOY2]MCZ3384961.1 hypothetical protein [Kosakonia sp. SOY2]
MPPYFLHHVQNVAPEMPGLQQTSGTGVPGSACFRTKAICFSENCDFVTGTTFVQGSMEHAGILFLDGTGVRVRINKKVADIFLV